MTTGSDTPGQAPSLVRVSDSGVPVGAGVLLESGRVLTCAHVVNDAHSRPELTADKPEEEVGVSFPYVGGREYRGVVDAWWPPPKDLDVLGDMALLRLLDPTPLACQPAALVSCQASGHAFTVVGFPDGYARSGLNAEGRLGRRGATGLVQITGLSEEPRIRRGFSGAPVWCLDCDGVAGVIVTATREHLEERIAFMIPAQEILAFVADSRMKSRPRGKTVWPSSVSVQGVPAHAHVEATIHLPREAEVSARLADGSALSLWQDGRMAMTTPTGGSISGTTISDTVHVVVGEEVMDVPVTIRAAEAPDSTTGWPETPDWARLRQVLSEWAANHRLVPDDLFSGTLTVRNVTTARLRITRVSVELSKGAAASPGPPTLDRLTEDELLTFGLPKDCAEVDGDVSILRLLGAPVRLACHECDDDHRVTCGRCGGSGFELCLRRVTCDACRGRGRMRLEGDGSSSCPACLGEGSKTCPRCSGRGSVTCTGCVGGRAHCPKCGGDGWAHHYTWASARRTRTTLERIAGPAEAADRRPCPQPMPMFGPEFDELPPEVAEELDQWYVSQSVERTSTEVLRWAELDVQAAFAVDYDDAGKPRTAYLFEPDLTVIAPGARSLTARRLRSAARAKFALRSRQRKGERELQP